MKKTYIKPIMGKGFLLVESPLLENSVLKAGEDITTGSVEGNSRSGRFWDASE